MKVLHFKQNRNMKKTLFTLLMTLFCTTSFAQTQQGIVKTRGRMVNGKLVAGTKLSGATITLNFGNALVSGSQGGFSFNVPNGKTYSLVMAKKLGYTLADPEITRRSFKYSASNPFYVVLEEENQRQADINAVTKKVRRTLIAQLQKREDEIEALKEQNKLTEEVYQQKLKELYDNQSKSEQLVKEMAERYASTDYDQLDEFNRQVQMYIEEGELLKADSLINTRGSIEERFAHVKEQESAYTQREAEILAEQVSLEKSRKVTQREKEDLMLDLYAKHTIYLQSYEQDSAVYCLKLRADLDTTILSNIREYAKMAFKQHKLYESEIAYEKLLNTYRSKSDTLNIASTLYSMGKIHHVLDNDSLCEDYYKESIRYYKYICSNSMDTLSLMSVYLALASKMSARNIGALEGRKMALSYCKEAEELMKSLNSDKLGDFLIDYIDYLLQQGIIYRNVLNYTNLEKMMMQNGQWEPIFIQDRDLYKQKISYLVNKSSALIAECNTLKSEFNLSFYASALSRLHILYKSINDTVLAHECLLESKRIFEQLYEKNPDAYRRHLAYQYYDLRSFEDSISSIYYTDIAINLFEELDKRFPKSFTEELYWLYIDAHTYLSEQQNYFQALENARKLVKIGNAYGVLPDALHNVALWYLKSKQNDKALKYIDEAIDINMSEYEKESSFAFSDDWLDSISKTGIALFITKGEIFLMQGKNEEALDMWKKVIELNPNFLDDYPDGTELSNGLKNLGLIE